MDPLAEALAGPEPMHAIREHIRKIADSPDEAVSVRPFLITLHCVRHPDCMLHVHLRHLLPPLHEGHTASWNQFGLSKRLGSVLTSAAG